MKRTISIMLALVFVFLMVPVSFALTQTSENEFVILGALCPDCSEGVLSIRYTPWSDWETISEFRCSKDPSKNDVWQERTRIKIEDCNTCSYLYEVVQSPSIIVCGHNPK